MVGLTTGQNDGRLSGQCLGFKDRHPFRPADGNKSPHEGNSKNPSWLHGWGIWSLSNIQTAIAKDMETSRFQPVFPWWGQRTQPSAHGCHGPAAFESRHISLLV